MRALYLAFALAAALPVAAQQTPATPAQPAVQSNWQHVEALPVGASIQVKARTGRANCRLKSVDAESLSCANGKALVFQRSDVITVKIPRHGRSALIGAGMGGGALAIIGFAAATNNDGGFLGPNFLRGPITAAFGAGGGLLGAVVGVTRDFARSTVYEVP